MASTTDSAGSTKGIAAFSVVLAMQLTVFGGVGDGASNVRKLVLLAMSSMFVTEVSSVSTAAAATDDVAADLLAFLGVNLLAAVSRFGSTRAFELKSTLLVALYLLPSLGSSLLELGSSVDVLSLFKSANCSQTFYL